LPGIQQERKNIAKQARVFSLPLEELGKTFDETIKNVDKTDFEAI
jgi:hypothetical protein